MLQKPLISILLSFGLLGCVNPFGEGSFDPNYAGIGNANLVFSNPSDADFGTVAIDKESIRTLFISNQGGRAAEYLAALDSHLQRNT